METIKHNGKVRGFSMTEGEFSDHSNNSDGGCLGCGKIIFGGVEPDAREYQCDYCGEHKVYGIDELLVMGKVEIFE